MLSLNSASNRDHQFAEEIIDQQPYELDLSIDIECTPSKEEKDSDGSEDEDIDAQTSFRLHDIRDISIVPHSGDKRKAELSSIVAASASSAPSKDATVEPHPGKRLKH